MNRPSISKRLDELVYEDDQYFSGFGARRLGVSQPHRHLEVEGSTSADGDRTYRVYRPAAMRRAAERSIRKGGGVRGLCSDHLRDGESIVVPGDTTVAQALSALREVMS